MGAVASCSARWAAVCSACGVARTARAFSGTPAAAGGDGGGVCTGGGCSGGSLANWRITPLPLRAMFFRAHKAQRPPQVAELAERIGRLLRLGLGRRGGRRVRGLRRGAQLGVLGALLLELLLELLDARTQVGHLGDGLPAALQLPCEPLDLGARGLRGVVPLLELVPEPRRLLVRLCEAPLGRRVTLHGCLQRPCADAPRLRDGHLDHVGLVGGAHQQRLERLRKLLRGGADHLQGVVGALHI